MEILLVLVIITTPPITSNIIIPPKVVVVQAHAQIQFDHDAHDDREACKNYAVL